ncbi:MAG: alpha/beta hydrolase-fold protein [bacterium]
MDIPGLEPALYHSNILDYRRAIVVWRPRQAVVTDRLPVLYLLHGVTGDEWDWIAKGNAPQTIQLLIDEGILPPMMLVSVNDGLYKAGTGYLNWADGSGQFEDNFIEELIPHVDQTWATIDNLKARWIGGLSMGGYGATHLGWNHPHLFGAIFALSSVLNASFMEPQPKQVFNDQDDMDSHWPLKLASHLPAESKLPYYLSCGTDDGFIEDNRKMARVLGESHYPKFVYEEFPGGHSWDFWSTHLNNAICYLVKITDFNFVSV